MSQTKAFVCKKRERSHPEASLFLFQTLQSTKICICSLMYSSTNYICLSFANKYNFKFYHEDLNMEN